MTTLTKKQEEEEVKLEEVADELAMNREMREATLDGLEARISANISSLESSDIDANMTMADDEIAGAVEKMMRADASDMEELEADLVAADAEEDQLLEDDELPVAETAASITPDQTGVNE
jgi:hypothetical protein